MLSFYEEESIFRNVLTLPFESVADSFDMLLERFPAIEVFFSTRAFMMWYT
jgi:hypothetical protein